MYTSSLWKEVVKLGLISNPRTLGSIFSTLVILPGTSTGLKVFHEPYVPGMWSLLSYCWKLTSGIFSSTSSSSRNLISKEWSVLFWISTKDATRSFFQFQSTIRLRNSTPSHSSTVNCFCDSKMNSEPLPSISTFLNPFSSREALVLK